MKIYIYKGGWFNGTRISSSEFSKLIGASRVNKFKEILKIKNQENKNVRTITVMVDKIKYDLTFDIQ